jgi:hypothetical protein
MWRKKVIPCLNYLAGIDGASLQQSLTGDHLKYASIGALVLMTAMFAGLSSAYAVFTVFEKSWAAVFCGALWGFMILNLDRLLLATFPKCQRRWLQALHLGPRLLLALLIGITIAHPLMLRLFEAEILDQVRQDHTDVAIKMQRTRELADEKEQSNREQIGKQLAPETVAIQEATADVAAARSVWERCESDLREYASCEAAGTCRKVYSRTAAVCEQNRRELRRAQLVLTKAQHTRDEHAQQLWDSSRDRQAKADGVYQPPAEIGFPSYLKRSEALATITRTRPAAKETVLFVTALILLVEITPILITFILPADSLDTLNHETQIEFSLQARTLAKQRIAHITTPTGSLPS